LARFLNRTELLGLCSRQPPNNLLSAPNPQAFARAGCRDKLQLWMPLASNEQFPAPSANRLFVLNIAGHQKTLTHRKLRQRECRRLSLRAATGCGDWNARLDLKLIAHFEKSFLFGLICVLWLP
jgi:hypothetical protein